MENWNDNLTDMVPNAGMGSAIFLIAIVVMGNWILLILMFAIITNTFAKLGIRTSTRNSKP